LIAHSTLFFDEFAPNGAADRAGAITISAYYLVGTIVAILSEARRYNLRRFATTRTRRSPVQQQQLQARCAELAEMNRRKDDFIATFGPNELRKSAAPHSDRTALLKRSGDDPKIAPKFKKSLERRDSAHMVRLIDDLAGCLADYSRQAATP